MTQRYPTIPVDQVVSEIRFSFSKMDERGEIDDELCKMNIKSALRMIGFNCYEPQEAIIRIKKYNGPLPADYYLFDNCYRVPYDYEIGQPIQVSTAMHPINYAEVRKVPGTDDNIIPGASPADQGFILDVKRRLIRTRFENGAVLLLFSTLPRDENGNLLMPDEEYTVKAVKAYSVMEMFREKAYTGEMPFNLWQSIQQDWDTSKDAATTAMRALTDMDMDNLIAATHARYRNFKIFRSP